MNKHLLRVMCIVCLLCMVCSCALSVTLSNEERVYSGSSTIILTVPQTYVLTFDCGDYGCVVIDDVVYSGTSSLIVTQLDTTEVTVLPFDGYALDLITASSGEGYTLHDNVFTVSNVLQNITFVLTFVPYSDTEMTIVPHDVVMAPGMDLTLSVAGLPENALVTWTIDNTKVASINQSGTVHASKKGTATVTASDRQRKATTSVTVRDLNTYTMPDMLAELDEEAMMNNTALENIVLSTRLTSIGARAFAGCTNLRFIRIPGSVQHIGDGCFSGCDKLIILCAEGSYAHSYAVGHGIRFQLID